jgi:hypothetical protein
MRTLRTILIVAGLALVCATAAQAQTRQRGFSVVLILGDAQPGPVADNVPPAVRKALTDVKDFLPYKSYRVLETQWVPGSKGGTSRLRGLDDQEYEIQITADEMLGGPHQGMLSVIFKLQEAGAPATSAEDFPRSLAALPVEQQRAAIERQLAKARDEQGPKDPRVQELEARLAGLKKQLALLRARRLIDSAFEMGVGETVVVGTSKLGGSDKALIVLLTAVSPSGK